MKKIKNLHPISLIIFFGLLIRLIAAPFFADGDLKSEWAILLHNFNISGIYGYNVVVNEYFAIPKFAEISEVVLPSVFMPPLYFFFIYIVDVIAGDYLNVVKLLISFQILLNLVSVIIIYQITKKFENKFIATLVSLLFTFFPLNIYASLQVSSITLQIFLILAFLFFIINLLNKINFKNLFFLSLSSAFLILIRGEFFLFYLLTLVYFFIFYKRRIKILILSAIFTSLIISPYIIRNYVNFDTIVLTKSLGYNLLKGNNPNLKIEGDPLFVEKKFSRENLKIKSNKNYEINLDNFYKIKAIDYIASDPAKFIKFYFLKVFSFIFIDINSSYPNYYNFFHIFPKLILSLSTILGIILVFKKKGFLQFLAIFYLFNILLFSIFFILPRYSLILLPIKLLLSTVILKKLSRKYINKFF